MRVSLRGTGALLTTSALWFTSCSSGPQVTNSSLQACEHSLAAVSRSVKGRRDSVAYAAAVLQVAGAISGRAIEGAFGQGLSFDADDRVTVQAPSADSSLIPLSMCDALNGLTARQIAQKADSLGPIAAAAYGLREARAYLRLLRAAAARYASVRDSLRGFEVVSAQLRQTRGFIGPEATIVLTVQNNTSHSVSRAYFRGKAISDGRQVPWLEEDFNYSVPGGLEPRERATWRLTPNMFQGAWNRVAVPASARFQVEVTQLDGPDRNPLWGGTRFTKADQRLLDSLAARYPGN
jgi:hypothetical protein